MKILFTGMASGHTNAEVHKSNLGFFGVLANSLESIGHEIEWRSPSILWDQKDLEQYDQIFIGIVPPTSLGANKVYGALHLINLLHRDARLTLVLDHPQLWQFKTSFAAVAREPKSLVTKFYAKRSEYSLVVENSKILDSFAEISSRMAAGKWPQTIYPTLPWKNVDDIARILGIHNIDTLTPLNLDAHLIDVDSVTNIEYSQVWLMDNLSTNWSRGVAKIVHHDIESMKTNKKETDLDILDKIRTSIGTMIAPQDRGVGTWWTYRYIQSLNAGTPVVTDWRESIQMSDSWGFLAYQIEEMSEPRRREVAKHQKESYLESIPGKLDSINQLKQILNTERKVQNA